MDISNAIKAGFMIPYRTETSELPHGSRAARTIPAEVVLLFGSVSLECISAPKGQDMVNDLLGS